MNPQALRNAATAIVAQNLTENVVAATVAWDERVQLLELKYFFVGTISDDDRESCELCMTELIAEFPEVLSCETACLDEDLLSGNQRGEVVFRRA